MTASLPTGPDVGAAMFGGIARRLPFPRRILKHPRLMHYNRLVAYVSNLRRMRNDADVDGRTVLAAAPPGYRLSVPDIDCDIGRFAEQKAAGIRAAAAGQFESAGRHLSAALAEWRGRALEDLPEYEFVAPFAALIEDEVNVHTARAEAEIACGRANAVIAALEGLTAEHPYREPLWAQLITAYYVAERQSDALDAYRRLTTALATDLGPSGVRLRNRASRLMATKRAVGTLVKRRLPPQRDYYSDLGIR